MKALTRARHGGNPVTDFLLVFLGSKSSELMGVRSQSEKITGLDEDEAYELISVATRKDWEAFEVVDF